MCPSCGTAVDVDAAKVDHECLRCGQEWTMRVDVERIAQFSPY